MWKIHTILMIIIPFTYVIGIGISPKNDGVFYNYKILLFSTTILLIIGMLPTTFSLFKRKKL